MNATVGLVTENRPRPAALVFRIRDRSVALGHAAANKVLVTPEKGSG
ncbi:MAG: hypothetical protein U0835_07100 [Isosphaeraceae bacterium]